MVDYITKKYKSIINKLKYIDSWFWCRYTLNVYNGCEHDCVYCDARKRKYNLQPEFESKIIIKENPDLMLDDRLAKSRSLLPDVVGLGGACDAYQPIEKKTRNTRKVLKVLLKHKFPVFALTKSTLITRDIDILSQINHACWATAAFTITTIDEEVAAALEPHSSPPEERFKALSKIKQDAPQMQAGVCVMPIIPFLEDNEENIDGIVRVAKTNGADFLLFAPGVTLQDVQATYFYEKIKDKFPDEYKLLLDFFSGKSIESRRWNQKINKQFLDACIKYKLPYRMKRFIPSDFRKLNYRVAEKLLNKAYDLQTNGKKYKDFLWTGLNIQNLKESLISVKNRGDIEAIKGLTRRVFNDVKPFLNKKTGLDRFI